MKKISIKSAFIALPVIVIVFSLAASLFAAIPGSLDPSFGVAGKVVTNGGFSEGMAAIAAQKDGKIVAAGSIVTATTRDFIVARYLANGALDATFDSDGIAITNIGSLDIARSIAFQSDGKTVVCGNSTVSNAAILRYNVNGNLDTTFDSDGIRTLNNVDCGSIAIQPDGKIVGVGDSVNVDLTVFRLNSNGSLDTTFGTTGIVSTPVSGTFNTFSRVKLQQDGKIVALGTTNNAANSVFFRYNTNGSRDLSFGGLIANIFLHNFAIDPADQLVMAAGYSSGLLTVVRLTSAGAIDPLFGGGFLQINLGQPAPNSASLLIQSDRKILLAATTNSGALPAKKAFLARLNRNGTPDTSFGLNGIFSDQALAASGEAATAFHGDRLILGSSIGGNANPDFQITRHNLSRSPSLNSDFDGDGVTDAAVFRPSAGSWFITRSSDNTFSSAQFGLSGDIPIEGDFDGDGRGDLCIFRPSSGEWFFTKSSDASSFGTQFGISTDNPVAGDYDKDGKTDIAVFRPSSGEWIILRSSSNFTTFFSFIFGQNGDIPVLKKSA